MNFLQKLFNGRPESASRYYVYTVKCRRCGEIISGRVDLENDLSVEYEGSDETYHCRKVLMGDGKSLCYQQLEVTFRFDSSRRLVSREIRPGGEFVEA